MRKIQLMKWAILLVLPLLAVSCKENDKDEPGASVDIAKNLVGKWLLASSDADNWVTYEFTETSRVNVETVSGNRYTYGSGFYSVDNDHKAVTGSYESGGGNQSYLDCMVNDVRTFQIDIDVYNNQSFVGETSVYRIVGNIQIEAGKELSPDYRGYTGQNRNTGFSSLNPEIFTVDDISGEVYGVSEGSSFLTFETSAGTAVVTVEVIESVKTFAEMIVGTWIYDNRAEHEWQRTIFNQDGTMTVEWNLDNNFEIGGFATGQFSVGDNKVNFTVRTDDGTQFIQEWRVEAINNFDCTYDCYDSGISVGRYTGHRLLDSITLVKSETSSPAYQSLVGSAVIEGYDSHNNTVAVVDSEGKITARRIGMTYIEVQTDRGTGVIEVNVVRQ